MINYILQVVLCQVLFLAVYDFFLSKETFFTKNRIYLLLTPVMSFLIPLIKIATFKNVIQQEQIVLLPEFVLNPDKVITTKFKEIGISESSSYINLIFWIGAAIFAIVFLLKLSRVIHLIINNKKEKKGNFTLIYLPKASKAFSFFNFIFLGDEVAEHQQEKVIAHEQVHSTQKHSLDLLFFEFLKIAMWFNPLVYLYQKRVTELHEFISDAVASKKETKESYINNLLASFFQIENIAFVNQFYKKSLLKKRIAMMMKTQSKQVYQLKYLLLIPALVSMLFYSACSENFEDLETFQEKKLQTKYRLQNNKLVSFEGTNFTYLDDYLGDNPPKEMKEISFDDLTSNEQNEFNEFYDMFEKSFTYSKPPKSNSFRFFTMPNGRNAYATIIEGLSFSGKTEKVEQREAVSFMTIEKAPTFPGCEEGDKVCFSKMVQKHFSQNFNADLTKNLGLTPGRKRVFIGFKIDTDGTIVDIQVRAPHPKIKEEVTRVMELLPKVKPGLQNNKEIAVKYSIPFTLSIE